MEGKKGDDSNVGMIGNNKLQKSYFDVLGLCCSSEIPMVEKILSSLQGIKDFSVVVPTKTVIVVHDPLLVTQLQIAKALNDARLEANVRAYGGREGSYKNKWPTPYALACGGLLLLSFLKYVYAPLQWLAVAAVAVGIPPVLLKAVAAVRSFRLDVNILVLITVSGSIVLRDYWEAATIVFLFTISEWLESRASHKATAVMTSLVSVVPQRAVVADTGEEVNADEVKVNTVLAVKAGEVIPIDGVVVEGSCEVDEKILTGESFPVAKQKDSTVWASTINLNGYISIKTTAMAEDCVVARMAKIVEEAQNKKSRTQRILDECAKYYTPAIVIISACLAVVPLAFGVQNKKEWYHLALVVLVSGCPCALLLSTPVAMFCALSKAATLGILFKGAEHLETLARVKIMAFDKTGTITQGEFEVVDFRSLQEDVNLNELLYWISSIESKSSHPMAAALVDYARRCKIEPTPDIVEHFHNFPGEGISGEVDGKELLIGNRKIAARAGCSAVPELEDCDVQGKSVGYVFLGTLPVGIFCLSDLCRTGVKEAMEELKSLGVKTVMLTGDSHGAAKCAQDQLGGALEVIHAGLLPEDKASIVKELQKEGRTAMIGDGLNDAPALATADIGVSMGVSGSALATESGDIVLMTNDILRIPKALHLARRVIRKIIENVVISIFTKVAILVLAAVGHPLVWAAVLADVGTCLLVILNSMLLLRGTSGHQERLRKHAHAHHESPCSDTEPCLSTKCRSNTKTNHVHQHKHKHKHAHKRSPCSDAHEHNQKHEHSACSEANEHNHKHEHSVCSDLKHNPNIGPSTCKHDHAQQSTSCSVHQQCSSKKCDPNKMVCHSDEPLPHDTHCHSHGTSKEARGHHHCLNKATTCDSKPDEHDHCMMDDCEQRSRGGEDDLAQCKSPHMVGCCRRHCCIMNEQQLLKGSLSEIVIE